MHSVERKRLGVLALLAYVCAVLGANYLTKHYGFVSMGFGLTASAGTYAAGTALFLRDNVQDTLGRFGVLLGILGSAALTLWISPSLAVASATAFLLAELADMAVYTPLRSRGWAKAVLASNIVGGIVDTFVFLNLAGFPVTVSGVEGQLAGKLIWATAVPVIVIVAIRALRQRWQPAEAIA